MRFKKITFPLPFLGIVGSKGRGYQVNRKYVSRLMCLLGLRALYPKKNLSKRRKEKAVFPYLLKLCPPVQPNDAWGVDITYIISGFCLFNGFDRCGES